MKSVARSFAPLLMGLLGLSACEQGVESVPLRSLERSGKAAFVCLGDQGDRPGRPFDDCGPYQTGAHDYSVPHLVALVTQTSRGEVAVIDVTGDTVVDANPSNPGFDFLPVGESPTDIVATPGGTASFVAVAEPNRPGIFALPSRSIRGGSPELLSWPACRLPAAPSAMELLIDPPSIPEDASSIRATCDAERGSSHPDLASCDSALDLSREERPMGARKLLVTLPELGAIAVVDAQALLCRVPGSFDACPIERIWELRSEVLPYGPDEVAKGGSEDEDKLVCAQAPAPESDVPGFAASAQPAQLAITDPDVFGPKRIYISDGNLPSIHVIDAPNPCEMTQLLPLRPQSAIDPKRTVVTSAIAVSPLTSDEKRFVYASDLKDGSVMAFDVSAGSSNPYPLIHRNAERDPLEPRDRIRFASPVRSIAFATRDKPFIDEKGVAQSGIQCNPAANASFAEAFYRTSADFTSGAGPRNLRGTFGFLALDSGQVVTVDLDDWDAACRRANAPLSLLGCGGEARVEGASGEASCHVVERHRPRSAYYFSYADAAGHHAPTMQTFPFLYGREGTVISGEQARGSGELPKLVGPDFSSSCSKAGADALSYVTVRWAPVVAAEAKPTPDSARNWVAFDLSEPRVHFEQDWNIAYEGVLPGFGGTVGRLQCSTSEGSSRFGCGKNDDAAWEIWDSSGNFCGKGVYDDRLAQAQPSLSRGDIVEIAEGYPGADDAYWSTVGDACSFIRCQATFGTLENPSSARDFTISEAYQDHVVLEARAIRDATDPSRTLPLDCCFPYPVAYTVRAQQHWLVTGSVSGYAHRVVANPETGRCEESCDPYLALRNARIAEIPQGEKPCTCNGEAKACGFGEESAYLFKNPQMQFSIWAGKSPSERGMSFVFHESGGFVPLYANLASSTILVSPQSMKYVRPLGQLAIADGGLLGLAFVNLDNVTLGRTYF